MVIFDWIASIIGIIIVLVIAAVLYVKNKNENTTIVKVKGKQYNWQPVGGPFLANGSVFIVEHCNKTQMYRYLKVPSNKKLQELTE